MNTVVRVTTASDASALQEIERLAGERFREVGMPEIADDEPFSSEELIGYAQSGRSWVALDAVGAPIGYVLVDVVDGRAHVEQLSVRPDHQGAGVGRALVDEVRAYASASGLPAITLTTFRDVPWNAPWYERLGFRMLTEREIGPGLQAVVDAETAHGLDPESRVCMCSAVRAEH